nr:MAG TPA: hypothetical protein [Caudoviricetes sp.]
MFYIFCNACITASNTASVDTTALYRFSQRKLRRLRFSLSSLCIGVHLLRVFGDGCAVQIQPAQAAAPSLFFVVVVHWCSSPACVRGWICRCVIGT